MILEATTMVLALGLELGFGAGEPGDMLRPMFSLRDKPLAEVCGFLSFETLAEKLEGIRKLGVASSLKPDFLQKTAEFFSADGND